MPLARRVVLSGLQGKGFILKNRDHRTLYFQTQDGLKTSVITHVSHGRRGGDISDNMLGLMAKQCKVNFRQFQNLVDCKLSQEGYEDLLTKQGILEPRDRLEDHCRDEEADTARNRRT